MFAFWIFVTVIGALIALLGVVLLLRRKRMIENVRRAEETLHLDYGGKIGFLFSSFLAVLMGLGIIAAAAARVSSLSRIEEFLRDIGEGPSGSGVGWLVVIFSICVVSTGAMLLLFAKRDLAVSHDETVTSAGLRAGLRYAVGVVSLMFGALILGVGIVILSYR